MQRDTRDATEERGGGGEIPSTSRSTLARGESPGVSLASVSRGCSEDQNEDTRGPVRVSAFVSREARFSWEMSREDGILRVSICSTVFAVVITALRGSSIDISRK